MAVKGRVPLFHRLRRGHRIPIRFYINSREKGCLPCQQRRPSILHRACYSRHALRWAIWPNRAPQIVELFFLFKCFRFRTLTISPSTRLSGWKLTSTSHSHSLRRWRRDDSGESRPDAQGQHSTNDGEFIESRNMKGQQRFSLVKYHVFMQGPLPGYPRTAVGATSRKMAPIWTPVSVVRTPDSGVTRHSTNPHHGP